VFDAFMPVFCLLTMEIFKGEFPVLRMRLHGAAHEEFACEVGDELSDWDYLKVSTKV
jgi:hypothetical protein